MMRQYLYIVFVIAMLCLQFLAPKCSAAKPFGVLHNLLDYALGRRSAVRPVARQHANATSVAVEDPETVVKMVERSINDSRRQLTDMPCGTGNPIDDCWRCDPNWEMNRQRLADCAIGFGRTAIGGKNGRYYLITDPSDNDAVNPVPGTLRHAVIQTEPLWIIFQRDMIIQLKEELIMNSFKTIDGRGVNVHIANGPCITIQYVTHIIIHGINIHDCIPGGNAMVRDSPTHYGWRTVSDGDGISIFGGSHIWVDHCSLSNCKDGLIDAIMGSTAITISNNHFSRHNEVMLLGHSDTYTPDVIMQVTIAFNHFGEGLVQRMPRCRHGYFHVVNNEYTHWEMYAIGGSASPTINSQGNRYYAPINPYAKEVTKRLNGDFNEWRTWNWRSEGDLMINGAFFIPSGAGAASSYAKASSLGAMPAALVGALTVDAGVLMNINRGMSLSPPNPIVSGGNPFISGGNPVVSGGNPMLSGADVLLADHHFVFHLSFAFFVLLMWSGSSCHF